MGLIASAAASSASCFLSLRYIQPIHPPKNIQTPPTKSHVLLEFGSSINSGFISWKSSVFFFPAHTSGFVGGGAAPLWAERASEMRPVERTAVGNRAGGRRGKQCRSRMVRGAFMILVEFDNCINVQNGQFVNMSAWIQRILAFVV